MTTSRLAHVRVGEGGRSLVLLHGFLGSGRNLTTFARRLTEAAPTLSVVLVDLTGHGSSPPLPPEADLATLAGDVVQTMDEVGVGAPAPLVGHSLGGRVALRVCLAAPHVIDRAVLLDISPSPLSPSPRQAVGTETSTVVEALLRAPASAPDRETFRAQFRGAGLSDGIVEWLLVNLVQEGGAYRWRVDRAALAALHERTSREDLWIAVEGPRPYRLACIRGGRSGHVSAADVLRLERAGCPVQTIEGAGHFLHVDRPAELLDLLLADLR